MQAQATGSGRFGFHRIVMLALAIGALISAATTLVVSDVVELPFTSESQEVTARPVDRLAGYNRIGFLEQNTQLPDGVLPVPAQSAERMRFLEQNTQLPTGTVSRPALSADDIRFLEQNTWAYDGDDVAQPAGDYLDPSIGDVLPSAPASAGIVSAPPQSVEHMRFLEQNVWEYAEAPATYARVNAEHPYLSRQEYTFLEQNIWEVEPADTSPERVGIHRDEGLNDGLGN